MTKFIFSGLVICFGLGLVFFRDASAGSDYNWEVGVNNQAAITISPITDDVQPINSLSTSTLAEINKPMAQVSGLPMTEISNTINLISGPGLMETSNSVNMANSATMKVMTGSSVLVSGAMPIDPGKPLIPITEQFPEVRDYFAPVAGSISIETMSYEDNVHR